MKIVHVCEYTAPARDAQGTQRVLESLAKAQVQLGHEVYLLINKDSQTDIAPVVDSLPEGFDIVHYHGGFASTFGHDIPDNRWITTNHGGGNDTPSTYAPFEKRHIVSVSEYTRKLIEGPLAIHNCVDPVDFKFQSNKSDYFLWIGGTDWEACAENKGLLQYCIPTAKKVNWKLKIAGTGRNIQIIDNIKRQCTDKIEYLGSVNGLAKIELIANAKALLMLGTIKDACPVTSIEAQMCGTPVIARNTAVHPELIENGVSGILCDFELDVIKAGMNVGKLKPELVRQHAEKHFSSKYIAEKYILAYQSMINFGTL